MADNSSAHSADAFISYASADAALANAIVEALEQNGLRCWIAPRDVVPGSLYADDIVGAINETQFLVLVLSEHALSSKHVGKEIERASSKGHPIIAIRTDAAPLTRAFEYFLSESQWIDVDKGGIEAAAAKLVAAIRRQTPESGAVHGQPSTPQISHIAPKSGRWPIALFVAIALVVGALVAAFWPATRPAQQVVVAPPPLAPVGETTTQVVSEKSIAVLPFTDMSEKHDQEYLADGMAEEILNLLAQAPDLLVSARTSSFYFKGKQTKIPDIARELGVAHILEGSIRRSGDHLRVTAQLVRADNGYHLWSETYDRDLRDIFKVQDEIANAVVQALQIKLMGGELSRRKGGTQNLEAYQLFLRAARSAVFQNTSSSLDAAEDYLNQAIKLDPSYGMAWWGLAESTFLKTIDGLLEPAEGLERVRQLAQHALQLSPDLVEARASLAWVHLLNWDWAAAGTELQRALGSDPTNVDALLAAGNLSLTLGRWDDAERQFRAALARDPLNRFSIENFAGLYLRTGRYAEAEATYRRLVEFVPDAGGFSFFIGVTLLLQGKSKEGLAMVQQEPDEALRVLGLPEALLANGRQAEADEALQTKIALWADRGAYSIAGSYAIRGDHDLALQWLERAYQQKDVDLRGIVGEPMFKNLADDPRFKAFLRKMNLPEQQPAPKVG